MTTDAAIDLLCAVVRQAKRDAGPQRPALSTTVAARREQVNRERERTRGLEHFEDVLNATTTKEQAQ